MKYFDSALWAMKDGEEFDISVHCDIKIFEWLLLYIEFKEKENNPYIWFFDIVNDRNDSKRVKP